ncbi:MAG: hypothetical protein R6V15_02790 [Desulfotignum sp.]
MSQYQRMQHKRIEEYFQDQVNPVCVMRMKLEHATPGVKACQISDSIRSDKPRILR